MRVEIADAYLGYARVPHVPSSSTRSRGLVDGEQLVGYWATNARDALARSRAKA